MRFFYFIILGIFLAILLAGCMAKINDYLKFDNKKDGETTGKAITQNLSQSLPVERKEPVKTPVYGDDLPPLPPE